MLMQQTTLTQQTTQAQETKATGNGVQNIPKTGDDGKIAVWGIIAIISLSALCTSALAARKKNAR